MFNKLTTDALNNIYNYLDGPSKHALMCVSKAHKPTTEDQKKMAAFVCSNYDVVFFSKAFSSLPSFFDKRLQRALSLGECHVARHERGLNSALVNLAWTPSSILNVEGGPESLKVAKEENCGQCNNIRQDATETADTWDLAEYEERGNQRLQMGIKQIRIVQELLKHFSKPFHYSKFSVFLKSRPTEELDALAEETRFTLKMMEGDDLFGIKYPGYQDYHSHAVAEEILIFYINKHNDELIAFDKEFFGTLYQKRNARLVAKTQEDLQVCKSVINIAGSSHIQDKQVIKGFKALESQYPFLSLTPKASISKSSVEESYERIFGKPLQLQDEEDSDLDWIDHEVNLGYSRYLAKQPVNLPHLEKLFQELDVDTVNADQNHYDVWMRLGQLLLLLQVV